MNEVICHGIPDSRPLEDGDVVKVDITASLTACHGDTCATFYAGAVADEVRDLGERTHEAMLRGIRAVAPGRPVSVIGRVIESYARRFGYGVVRDYTGHGVGPSFHTQPTILHYDEPRGDHDHGAGDDVHHRTHAHPGGVDWLMWDDGWTCSPRRFVGRAVGAHPSSSPTAAPRSSPCHRPSSAFPTRRPLLVARNWGIS